MMDKKVASSAKFVAALLVCVTGGAMQSAAIASPPQDASVNTPQASDQIGTAAEVASQPITPLVATDSVLSSDRSAADTISHEAVDLQPQFSSAETFEITTTAFDQQLFLAREVDLETLCRSFPLNSRCAQPSEDTEAEIETEMETDTETETTETETTETARKDGVYIRLGAGFQNRADAQDFIGRASFDTGPKLNGAVGYRHSDFRAELEYTYFRNDFDELTFFETGTTTPVAGPPETSPGSYVDGRALMLNVYYDIPVSRRFKPYIGGGIGVYNAYINDLAPPSFGGFEANGFSSSRFAFQLRAGLGYAITDALDISLGYRYFQGNTFEYDIKDSPLLLEPNGLETNGLELSLTYTF